MWGRPAAGWTFEVTSSPRATSPFREPSCIALEGDPAGLLPLMGFDMARIMCETLVVWGVRPPSRPNPTDLSRGNPSGVRVDDDALDEDTEIGEEPWGWGMSDVDPAGARLGWVWMTSLLAGRVALV